MASESVFHYSTAAPRPFRSFLHPLRMARNLWSHRDLILQLAYRDIAGRYRAAKLGLLWSVLTPLIMLAIYTFVFSVVFQTKWGGKATEGHGEFALYLFCGMLVFNLFGEVVSRAPGMVASNPNYVKKVVFPLEVLVPSGLLTALFNMLIGYGVWLLFWFALRFSLPAVTMLLLPLVVLPLCLTTIGVAWVIASVGVFLRDIGHAVGLAVQALFFATPVFYRIDQVPHPFRMVLQANPLSAALESARGVMIEGAVPDWRWWCASLVGSAVLALLGYAFFMKSKKAFADVL